MGGYKYDRAQNDRNSNVPTQPVIILLPSKCASLALILLGLSYFYNYYQVPVSNANSPLCVGGAKVRMGI